MGNNHVGLEVFIINAWDTATLTQKGGEYEHTTLIKSIDENVITDHDGHSEFIHPVTIIHVKQINAMKSEKEMIMTTQHQQHNSIHKGFSVLALTCSLLFTGMAQAATYMADFNGDGLEDYVVPSPHDTVNGRTAAGAVAVRYGADGAYKSHEHEAVWTFYSQDTPGVRGAPEAYDQFGSAVAMGDFNGDGYDDLAIGAADEGIGTWTRAGVVQVLYGSATGLQGLQAPMLHMGNLGSGYLQKKIYFGHDLAAGDFNQDGYMDLAVGAPSYDVNDINGAGAVVTYWGSRDGLLPATARLHKQGDSTIGEQPEVGDWFGTALAAADFDQDGYDDLAIGNPEEGFVAGSTQFNRAGLVTVLSGGSTGFAFGRTITLVDSHASSGATVEADDQFGRTLEPGDFNGDGYPDLAIGAPGETTRAQHDGAVTIVYSGATGLQTNARQYWHGAVSTLPDKGEENDKMGRALAAGDFNNDGYDDLAIGVPWEKQERTWWPDRDDTGQVTVISGSAQGLLPGTERVWHQDKSGVIGGREAKDYFGHWLAVADVNHDHIADLIVSVPGEDRTIPVSSPVYPYTRLQSLKNVGIAHVFYGTHGDGLSTNPALGKQARYQPTSSNVFEPYKATEGDFFGAGEFIHEFNF